MKVTKKFEQGIDEWMKEASFPGELRKDFKELVVRVSESWGQNLEKSADLAAKFNEIWSNLSIPQKQGIIGALAGGGLGFLTPYLLGTEASGIKRWTPGVLGTALGGFSGYQLGRLAEAIVEHPLYKGVAALGEGRIDPQLMSQAVDLANIAGSKAADKLLGVAQNKLETLLKARDSAKVIRAADRPGSAMTLMVDNMIGGPKFTTDEGKPKSFGDMGNELVGWLAWQLLK